MKRRTKAVLLIGSLAVATSVVTLAVLTTALARAVDPHQYCATGFSWLVSCNLHWSSKTVGQSDPDPAFVAAASATGTASSPRSALQPTYVEVTAWAAAQCPENSIARRLLCPTPSIEATARAASDDLATGLPRPTPWLVTAAKNSRFIESVHVETPLDLAAVLRFYRAELGKRGWTENGGAVVGPDAATIAFTTSDGPALLRLARRHDRTIADLALRKPADAKPDIAPAQGQVKLLLGNTTDDDAVISIDGQTIALAARAGHDLTENPATARKSPDSLDIDLPPGKYQITLEVADAATQTRELELAADETWGMLVGQHGVVLPMRLY